ncbi:hypothetical protein [Catellatospora citrea]|uniref:Uncharacterized protein n=1 Tax=Catellatospora citrea TaxID=53366 RepID=A0A8J3P4A3_9ACTN|nr:hypothetical protein [Catellatospora citrea]RKE08358.1 hypothetical protein C8E86_3208 [Catellatospora citrea]GIG03167.1 hypothetical protein Cci01nite_82600 [Catellatospora citrea]
MSNTEGNAVLVNVLSSSVRSALNGMETAPGLIRRVIEEEAWRSFVTPRGEQVEHETFDSFITTAPTAGLGQTVVDLVRLVADDKETLSLLAAALGVHVSDLPTGPWADDAILHIDKDARDFGRHTSAGGWLLGLMVARSVHPRPAPTVARSTRRNGRAAHVPTADKITAAEFALKAGCSSERVMRFYRAWERAAAAGVVPSPDKLIPGVEVDLPDLDSWSEYYTSIERTSERRENIAQQAEATGTSYLSAVQVAERPGALRTAIMADGRTAETAFHALLHRMDEDPDLQSLVARSIAELPSARKAVSDEAKRTEGMEFIRRVADEGTAKTPGGEVVQLNESALRVVKDQLAIVTGPQSSHQTVKAALSVVQDAITEVIEGDPELSRLEQQVKVRKMLLSTARTIETINPTDLGDLADDHIRETVEALQRRINELADSIAEPRTRRLRAV